MTIQILRAAENHLDAIFSWYKDKGRDTAKKMCRQIKEELLLLADHPKMGKVDTLFSNDEDQYRSIPVAKGRFKVIYYIDDTTVYIAGIVSCLQDTETLLSKIPRKD